MNTSSRATDHSYAVKTNIEQDTQVAPQRAHLQLAIEGMSCQACASRIEKVLNKKPSVYESSVNFG